MEPLRAGWGIVIDAVGTADAIYALSDSSRTNLPPKKVAGLVGGPGVPAASRVRMYNVGTITPVYFPPGPEVAAPGNAAL